MIIVGYQGIGKSTLGGKHNYIDLESGNFGHNGERPEDWFIYYCQIAEHLSKQGYDVFVSSHKEVRNYLRWRCNERVICIVPSIFLEDRWLSKLEDRHNDTGLEKDRK